MSRSRQGLVAAAMLLALVPVVLHTAGAQFFPEDEPTNDRIVFGCDPGPIEEFVHADPPVPPPLIPDRRQAPRAARLTVYGDRPVHLQAAAEALFGQLTPTGRVP